MDPSYVSDEFIGSNATSETVACNEYIDGNVRDGMSKFTMKQPPVRQEEQNDDTFLESFDDDFIKHQQRILAQIENEKNSARSDGGVEVYPSQDKHSTTDNFLGQKMPAKPNVGISSRDINPILRESSLQTQSTAFMSQSSMTSLDLQSHCSDRMMGRNDNSERSNFRCVSPSTSTTRQYYSEQDDAAVVHRQQQEDENDEGGDDDNDDHHRPSSFTDLLQDAEMIREQAKILEQIQAEQRQRRNVEEQQEECRQHATEYGRSNSTTFSLAAGRGQARGKEGNLGSSRTLQDFARATTDSLHRQVANYTAASRIVSRYDLEELSAPCVNIMSHSGIQTAASGGVRNSSSVLARMGSPSLPPSSAQGSNGRVGTTPSKDVPLSSSKNRSILKGPSTSSSSASFLRRQHQTDDQVVKVGNRNLKVKGTEKTFEAIARGKAIVVQCPTCAAILQVSSTAKLLYCVICKNVTPVNLSRDQTVVDPSSSTEGVDTSALDSRIARTLQDQEMDIACARKLASHSNTSSR
mmetsp:Transcript_43741/g.106067  ORF Transcript_43741/g.106067 Transcript_43741/m.106067 type:complete len:523 (+) Transcript_43741:250-1818(+)|eukprot:CAMPEP_0113495162 /NCGR_PEP_ID=MMETSP0014_2-20120614/29473_1 /TAXON_ID=2857 /ORGANISM="Nitzschia sp." /LENGTH=522 /DNA_ID=CAMNT_0000389063 /DNA_START=936 /DNA_END=2504 /DNA_ORIENTATION=- /assembly_acc=CAM_ASM_000159